MNNVPNYRIGNDLPIVFLVEDTGTTMTSDNTTIILYNPYGHTVDISWNISGNEVSGMFLGKDQKFTGLYAVKVIVNKGLPGMVTRDMQLFRLVPHSWQANNDLPISVDSSESSSSDSSSSDS